MNKICVNVDSFVKLLQKQIKETEDKNRTTTIVPVGLLAAALEMAEFYQSENKLLFIDRKYAKEK